MKKKIIVLCATLVALILEILPYGAVCNFANPEGEPWRKTYSYFDLTPFGYANFAPFLVALLTCALMILTVASIVIKKPLRIPTITTSAIATALSLAPLLYGLRYFSLVGALISAVLFITTALAVVKERKDTL